MRFTKKGFPKFGKGDVRVGKHFVIHDERGHYKIEPVSGWFSLRVPKRAHAGMMITAALVSREKGEDEGARFLESYCAVVMNFLSAVPDVEFLTAVNDAAIADVDRHKDLYGVRDEVDPADDAKVLQEEKELAEAEEAARKEVGV